MNKLKGFIFDSTPAKIIFRYYVVILLSGAVLLMMPFSLQSGSKLNFIEALFTATSATSVTGLVVYNTPFTFTTFGILVILVLIKLGGYGVIVIKTSLYILLKRKIGMKDRELIMTEQSQVGMGGMVRLVKYILMIVTLTELTGMVLLSLRFYFHYDYGLGNSLWFGLFHSISAVNNAGFDITGASLMPFVNDLFIQTVFIFLIIFGGIGFPAILDIYEFLKHKFSGKEAKFKFSIFTKVSCAAYFVIFLVSFISILGLEWNNYLAVSGYNFFEKIYVALFSAITTRNAGFATVDMSQFSNATILLMTIMMFIGAAPSSTGGGIRTTTFILAILFINGIVIGDKRVTLFKRRIKDATVFRAVSIMLIGIIINIVAVFLLMIVEPFDMSTLAFEVASAFGTTGLSLGITSGLSSFSLIVLTIVMLIGQMGITTSLLVFMNKKPDPNISYPETDILIG